MSYYVYVVGCADHSLYTGTSADAKKRIRAHALRLASAAKYTKSHPVVSVEGLWEAADKRAALSFEARFKRLSREKKQALLENPAAVAEFLPMLSAENYAPKKLTLEECLGK